MGSIRITETSQVGEAYNTVEYEFSDASDFFAWDEYKAERLTSALRSFVGSLDPEDSVNYRSASLDTQDEVENNVTEIKVGKKAKEPTKH
jgi:hypothetical protein